VLQIHGTADAIVAYNGGFGGKSVDEVLGLWTSLDTCVTPPLVAALPDLVAEGSTVERHTWAPCSSNTQVQLLKIINGGHTWPGALLSGIGNTNQDIDASVEIWNFFKQFTLNATSTTSEQWLQNDIQVFPNPAQTQVSITSENSQNTLEKVRIWDLSGKLLADSGPLATATCQLPLNSIHNGMVIVEVQSQRGTYYSRLMVQK
jgi:polyhydroxybutyrate depolymerase